MKVIAFYLPQFHSIPENDEWWGKGFTEWTNVKNAKPLFEGHEQPKIPLNDNYYNLLDDDVKIWQAKLAKEYGIYGFCYYHYWFNGKMLLEKPMEQMLANKRIDIPFCISWCNEPWTSIWVGNEKKVLISQNYGNKSEWIDHYNYLSQFFKDDRYIFKDNKPVMLIYRPDVIPNLKSILKCWNELAIKDGFKGITFMCVLKDNIKIDREYFLFDCIIDSLLSFYMLHSSINNELYYIIKKIINKQYEKVFGHSFNNSRIANAIKFMLKPFRTKKVNAVSNYPDYGVVLNKMLSFAPTTKKSIPCYYVNWDNTPRYNERGLALCNVSADIFKEYFNNCVIKTKNVYKSDIMFLAAWNEWAEGNYLEPDELYKFGFLNAIKEVLCELNEFPN